MKLEEKLYKKNNDYKSVKAVVSFYSLKINEDNKIFTLTDGEGLVKSVSIDLPMVTGTF
ncbi:MAG: hypothetical protein Kow0029_22590 [Candidatus Rifleibacteriota bacterium]